MRAEFGQDKESQTVSAGGKAKTGYKYRSIGWNINVKKDGVDHNIYVADSEGSRYEETVGSTVYTSVHFSESLISEKSGVSLRTGSITMIANARMEAYRASDNKIYSTNNSWTEWCAHADWANKAIREALERYTDGSKTRQYKDTYYNKVICWSSYYFDVKPGTGVSKTTGSGWYSAWSTASYGGTAKTGYHGTKSGTKTITRNDSVTVTADPNILTLNYSRLYRESG